MIRKESTLWPILILILVSIFLTLQMVWRPFFGEENKERSVLFYKFLHLHGAILNYQHDQSTLPSESEWDSSLIRYSEAVAVGKHSILSPSDFIDCWGNQFRFQLLEQVGGRPADFVLYSVGANEIDEKGLGDDLLADDGSFPEYLGGDAFTEQKYRILNKKEK